MVRGTVLPLTLTPDLCPLTLDPKNGGVIMSVMEKKIVWETDMKKALSRAKAGKKYVMLDFFNPG